MSFRLRRPKNRAGTGVQDIEGMGPPSAVRNRWRGWCHDRWFSGDCTMKTAMKMAFALLALSAGPALAIEPYTPVAVKPGNVVTPDEGLIADARAFLEALKSGNGDAIDAAIADKVTTVDGGLDLTFPRNKQVIGPFETIEDMLAALGLNSAEGLPVAMEPASADADKKIAINAGRQYIVDALTDGKSWGTDPMVKGAVCSSAYRSFDAKALKALVKKTGVSGSSWSYLDQAYDLRKAPDRNAEVAGTLEPNVLYPFDYDTDAPRGWQAVYLPDGTSGFAEFDVALFQKPFGGGVCFAKGKDGHWQMVAQVSTSL